LLSVLIRKFELDGFHFKKLVACILKSFLVKKFHYSVSQPT